jgi:RNA polymerase sigma factor (sigma-70 family)
LLDKAEREFQMPNPPLIRRETHSTITWPRNRLTESLEAKRVENRDIVNVTAVSDQTSKSDKSQGNVRFWKLAIMLPTEYTMKKSNCIDDSRNESELIALIEAGNSDLFCDLVRPYEQRIYRIAMTFLRNEADAQDVIQQSLLKAFLNLNKFRAESRFSTWLTSITLNEAKGLLRSRRRVPYGPFDGCTEHPMNLFDELPCPRPLPIQVAQQNEMSHIVASAILGLQPAYRSIYLLREIEEYSTQKAAERLGIPISLAKTRLHRARKILHERLHVLVHSRSPVIPQRTAPPLQRRRQPVDRNSLSSDTQSQGSWGDVRMLPVYRANAAVILVHGPWFDTCMWNSVILPLRREGLQVAAVQLPLTSFAEDTETLRRALRRAHGPIVLASHSYAGAVASDVAGSDQQVAGLVYVSALAPDESESSRDLLQRNPTFGSPFHAPVDQFGFIWATEDDFADFIAPRSMPHQWTLMAATQRPISERCLEAKIYQPGWRSKPSWFLVAEEDGVLDPRTQRLMAERMRASIVSRPVDHASPITDPDSVVEVILEAAHATLQWRAVHSQRTFW